MNKSLFLFVLVFYVTRTNSLYTDAEKLNTPLNGRLATEDQFPFMVSLQRLSEIHSADRGHRCGGVLVSLQHAVTAASCILDLDNDQMIPINRDEYRVFTGSVLLSNDDSADRIRLIANTTAHPEYNPSVNSYVHNIAVITLVSPFSSNTVAILSARNMGYTEMPQGTIIGWGKGTQLMYATMITPNETVCAASMGQSLPNLFCGWAPNVTGNSGHAGCEGYLGGPLIYSHDLAGLIVDTTFSKPHWYLRVHNYFRWVDRVVSPPVPVLRPDPPPPTTTTTTTPAPEAASIFHPELTLLVRAVIAIVKITGNAIH